MAAHPPRSNPWCARTVNSRCPHQRMRSGGGSPCASKPGCGTDRWQSPGELFQCADRLRSLGPMPDLDTTADRELITVLLHGATLTQRTTAAEAVPLAERVLQHEPATPDHIHTALPLLADILIASDSLATIGPWLESAYQRARRDNASVARAVIAVELTQLALAHGRIDQARVHADRGALPRRHRLGHAPDADTPGSRRGPGPRHGAHPATADRWSRWRRPRPSPRPAATPARFGRSTTWRSRHRAGMSPRLGPFCGARRLAQSRLGALAVLDGWPPLPDGTSGACARPHRGGVRAGGPLGWTGSHRSCPAGAGRPPQGCGRPRPPQ